MAQAQMLGRTPSMLARLLRERASRAISTKDR
jgi:hypothetical protein